jgi:SlyX protein
VEDPIIDLQSRLAFQEDHLDQLNTTVARQQLEIEALQRQLGELRRELREMAVNARPAGAETPPPHY